MTEIWREIEGESGYYVSSLGRIKSDNYRNTGQDGFMTPSIDSKNKCTVVCIRHRIYKVRRLVAQAFIPNPEGYSDVTHKNGDFTDCRAENLEWVYHNLRRKR